MKYTHYFKTESDIEAIRTAIRNLENEDDQEIDKVDEHIEKFLKLNKLGDHALVETEFLYQAVEHYLMMVLIIGKHKNSGTGWSTETYKDFVLSATRIMELLLYVAIKDDNALNKIFLKKDDGSYYNFLRAIAGEMDSDAFDITKQDHVNFLWLKCAEMEKATYRSSIVTQPFLEEGNLFEKYFKLKDIYVKRLYEMDYSDNRIDGRNPSGIWGKRVPFSRVTEAEKIVITTIRIGKVDETEPNAYTHLRSLQDPQLNMDVAKLVDANHADKIAKSDTSSAFKRHLIAKAVGNSIVKKNLVLRSDYNRTEFEYLCKIGMKLIETGNLYADIILWSVLIGVSVEKILTMFLSSDDDFTYLVTKQTLKIKLSSIFSDQIASPMAYITKDQHALVEFQDWMHMWWTDTSKKVFMALRDIDLYKIVSAAGIDTENFTPDDKRALFSSNEKFKDELAHADKLNTAISKFKKSLSDQEKTVVAEIKAAELLVSIMKNEAGRFLSRQLDGEKKTIKISLESLSHLSMHFYCLFNGGPTANLLFMTHKSKSDEAKLTYNASNHKLVHYEKWLHEFTDKLGVKSHLIKLYRLELQRIPIENDTLKVGSRLYIKPGNFKNFILDLDNIQVTDEIDKVNLLMIVIRYLLCVSLATRKASFSSSINDYSKRMKILFLQEKAKNMFSSKREIPLSDRALEIIGWFEKVKQKYALSSNVPVLLQLEGTGTITEIQMSKKSIEEYLRLVCGDDKEKEFILKFVRTTYLNFGRHVFTSFVSVDSSIPQKYIDAFLGHYSIGTEDQGRYTDFNNADYIATMRDVIKEIEGHYFPLSIGVEKYVPTTHS